MRVETYLLFDGTCEEAFRFYEKVLGGKIQMLQRAAGTPAEGNVPPDFRDKVLHVRMSVGDTWIMGSDCPPGQFEHPQGFNACIGLGDLAEGQRIFDSLAEGGKINMPFGKTFWAEGFGMLVDRFGTPWMVNVESHP